MYFSVLMPVYHKDSPSALKEALDSLVFIYGLSGCIFKSIFLVHV